MCSNGRCSNMDGSFKCLCNEGFQISVSGLSCLDIDECRENPLICLHGRCRNTVGSYVCECEDGYLHSADGGFCIDRNECEDDVCGQNGRCVNTEGIEMKVPNFNILYTSVSAEAVLFAEAVFLLLHEKPHLETTLINGGFLS